MTEKFVIITVGPPGCGKSTWAYKHIREQSIQNSELLHINRDDLRNMLSIGAYNDGKYRFDKEGLITKVSQFLIKEFEENEKYKFLILSDTHMNLGVLKNQTEYFIKKGYPIFSKTFFDLDVETLRSRVSTRNAYERGPPIPEFVIKQMMDKIPEISTYINQQKEKGNIIELC